MSTFKLWCEKFDALDGDCPWPGPRPLVMQSDARHYVKREDDAYRFVRGVMQHRLFVLSGDSGIGKSSLISNELIPSLEAAGYEVFVCREWSRGQQIEVKGIDADRFIQSKLASNYPSVTSSDALIDQLEGRFGDACVLVFDQFEEVIRGSPQLFAALIDWITHTNKNSRLRVVISLRQEYTPRLKPIESAAVPFSLGRLDLEPITDVAHIEKVIDKGGRSISKRAKDEILKQWKQLHLWEGIGLLHLQATLYALHAYAAKPTIEYADIRAFIDRSSDAASTESRATPINSAARLFRLGLLKSAERKLRLCEQACIDAKIDNTLTIGTKFAALRMMPHLSSGGYKLDRETWELAALALEREFGQLLSVSSKPTSDDDISKDSARAAFRVLEAAASAAVPGASSLGSSQARTASEVGDLLGYPRERVAAECNVRLTPTPQSSNAQADGLDYAPWVFDPHDVSAGPMLGMQRGEILIEELRRVVFAQKWFEKSWLVRSTPREKGTVFSLTHDGFATAVEDIGAHVDTEPADGFYLLTAAKGRVFTWGLSRELNDRTWINLRWRDCQVTAIFCRVVFVNCDFTGTRFVGCSFEGVTFVNCILDNACFDNCTVIGETSASVRKSKKNDGMPSFMIEGAEDDSILSLARYRQAKGVSSVGSRVFSRTSGISALPALASHHASNTWRRETGGLAMYGGRLASLIVKGGAFRDGGTIALNYVAGSALDIVETRGCSVSVVSSAIRGLTLTRPLRAKGSSTVKVNAVDSLIANCWFGGGLSGDAVFKECKVYHLQSLSDALKIELPVHSKDKRRSTAAVGAFDASGRAIDSDPAPPMTAGEAERMDYRSDPARRELEG